MLSADIAVENAIMPISDNELLFYQDYENRQRRTSYSASHQACTKLSK